jgi:ribonuclease T
MIEDTPDRASPEPPPIAGRFRGFLPVVVDVETAGFDPQRHALLEIAAVVLRMTPAGTLEPAAPLACHVLPFLGSEIDPKALAFNGIDPDHPFRDAVPEQEALARILVPIRRAVKAAGCNRAILVGHNAHFDLGFLKAAVERTGFKRNPFHAFSVFDTVTLGGLAFGQTVLAKAALAAGLGWQHSEAHSAIYDAQQTARLFCAVVNRWRELDPVRRWEGARLPAGGGPELDDSVEV